MFRKLYLLGFIFIIPFIANAQGFEAGDQELSLGWGLLTKSELDGVNNNSKMDIPYGFTGAIFVSYKYYIQDRIAIGANIGFDNVKGNLTQGNPKYYNYGGIPGTYVRNTVTIAPSITFKYFGSADYTSYGAISFGYTFSSLDDVYDKDSYAYSFQNGVTTAKQPNPYHVNEDQFNFQITALGFRRGERIAFFMEFGYGYMGVVRSGISMKL